LAERSQPFLPEGAQVRQVFICQTGPNPALLIITYLVYFWIKYRTVCVTQDAIYVIRGSKLTGRPQEVIATLPRQTRIGPMSGMVWGKIDLMGQRHWVHKRFFKDVEAADLEASMFATPPQN